MAQLHFPVMLQEALDGLNIKPDGIYLDGTFGRGGHSRAILEKLGEQGHLYALDRDAQAIEAGRELEDTRFSLFQLTFSRLGEFCEQQDLVGRLDGILLDIGVSSPQLDDPERGFSFDKDGPLDMRMDRSSGRTAADLVNTLPKSELARIFKEYGEERFASKVAAAIVHDREQTPFSSTLQLAGLMERVIPTSREHKHKATRCFQALRIAVNGELDELQSVLKQSVSVLRSGGRICVITFHSLEDRIVKNYFKQASMGQSTPAGLPLTYAQTERIRLSTATLRLIGGPLKAQPAELSQNVRSRSATLRVAERL
ncbi:MAG: 16S rRNA (cytosine(1402)-N(4))-methyltransferase RsmH [Succinivibrio sp.]|nr:16S rRNA (cytosine(1402)-N(4))-methyltransferase RsmH [Succinivibrio sp.]